MKSIVIRTKKNKLITIPTWPIVLLIVALIIVSVPFIVPVMPSFSTISYNEAYNKLYEAVIRQERQVTVKKTLTGRSWLNALYRITEGEPELFHVASARYGEEGDNYVVTFGYNGYAEDYEKNVGDFRRRISEIADMLPPGLNDYEKAQWFNDWMISNCSYDGALSAFDAYTMLLEGSGVCTAYALLYKALLDAAGVKNVTVTGNTPEGGHAWNLVRLDGVWYHTDVTWNDSGKEEDRYRYFLVSDNFMRNNAHLSWNAVDNHAYFALFSRAAPGKSMYGDNTETQTDNLYRYNIYFLYLERLRQAYLLGVPENLRSAAQ